MLSFTWKNGRQLFSLQNGSSVINYTYNADGVKTAAYTVCGTQILSENNGSNTTGNLIAVQDGPSHVSIKPRNGTMSDWIKAGTNSIWTKTLKQIVKRYPR